MPLEDGGLDLLDIPMDDIEDINELDQYLAKPLKKVRDPIAWWWDHRASYPKLSKMAYDYLSVPRMSFKFTVPFTTVTMIPSHINGRRTRLLSRAATAEFHLQPALWVINSCTALPWGLESERFNCYSRCCRGY
jgi:hypothetical protein